MIEKINNLISEVVDTELTQERAIEIFDSKWWNDATDVQIAYIQLHQPLLICDFHRFHQACERVIDSPIQSMSFGMRSLVDKLTGMVNEKYRANSREGLCTCPDHRRDIGDE